LKLPSVRRFDTFVKITLRAASGIEEQQMARRSGVTPSPPSLNPEQAIPILEELIRNGEEKIRNEKYDSPRRDEWIHTADGALTAALGSGDSAIQSFSGAQCGVYGPYETDETLRQQADRQLDGMLAVLRSVVQQLRWKLPNPRQIFMPAGSEHDAYVQIRSIVRQATAEIFIVDPWIDGTLWPLLTNIPGSCKVRILGEHLKGDFALEANRFVIQHGTSVEIRKTYNYHDRFIFLDGKRCFHLGASIKDAGSKAFALSEFERAQIIALTLADAQAEWARATPVVI